MNGPAVAQRANTPMKITCQSCQSKYTVSDEKVQGKTVKIKCRKCGATILVNSGGVTTSGAAVADPMSVSTGPSADGGPSYLVNVTDGDQRNMSLAELVAAYNTSVVNAETYVWADGMSDWMPIGQVDAIVTALNAPPEAAVSASSPPAAAAPVAVAAPAAQEHRAAAKRETGRAAQDLFSAKPAEDVATSAPSYNNGAAARPAASASLGASAGMAATGHREENSMLFSLSALTAKVGNSPSSAPKATTARDREDSGIIDLKALAAAAAAAPAPAAAALLPDVGLFPLGAPPVSAPVAAPPVVAPSMPPAKSKTPLFIGVGAVVALGAIVGAFMLMNRPPPQPPAPVAAAETPTATPAPTVTATATATAVAAAEPTASASASAAPTASAVAKGGRGAPVGVARPSGGFARPAAPAAAPAAPAAPKRGNCGCAAGDLLCAMKCSAHK